MSRRVPVYFLVDCSGSMAGERMEMVRAGIDSIINVLLSTPDTVDCAWVSVITFSGQAKELVPLTSLWHFEMPGFDVDMDHPGTSLGQALELLERCVRRDYRPGDWMPGGWKSGRDYHAVVLIFTDGNPSDTAAYNKMTERIRSGAVPNLRPSHIHVLVVGGNVYPDQMYRLIGEENLVLLPDCRPVDFDRFFDLTEYEVPYWLNKVQNEL